MADVYSNLKISCSVGQNYQVKLFYETPDPLRKHGLTGYLSVTHEGSGQPTVETVFNLLRNGIIKPLSAVQTKGCRWLSAELAPLDEHNAPRVLYHQRLGGCFGRQDATYFDPDKALRFELRSLDLDGDKASEAAKSRSYRAFSQRQINLRGIPETFRNYERSESSLLALVEQIADVFVNEHVDEPTKLGLTFRMPVHRPSEPVKLQPVVSASALGLCTSPLTGRQRKA